MPSLLGTELEDKVQSLPWAPGTTTHVSVLPVLCILLQSFHWRGQSKFLKLWPDWRTSKRRDRLADLQDAGLPGRHFGEAWSLLLSHLTVVYKLQVTPWGNPTLHVGQRSWDQGVHLVQVVSPVGAETRPQAFE